MSRGRYLQWCLRCSRCNGRRCHVLVHSGSLDEVHPEAPRPRRLAPRRRLVLPGRGRLELGGPGVPGDGCGSDRPDPPWAGALRLAGRRRGGGRPRAGTGALGQWLDTARAGITRLRPESFRGQFARTPGLQRRTAARRARRASMTSIMTCRMPAAATCLRRRNTLLPGIICRRLQITAVMLGGPSGRRGSRRGTERSFCPGSFGRAGRSGGCGSGGHWSR